MVGVTVGGSVRVGGTVEVEVDGRVAVTEAGSGVVCSGVLVWVCLNVGKGVGVRSVRFVGNDVGVFVNSSTVGEMSVGVEGAKI